MRGSRGRLSGTSVFLSGAFLAVWAVGAVARVPLEGGAWSFSGVIRIKDSVPRSASREGGARSRGDAFPPCCRYGRSGPSMSAPASFPRWDCSCRERGVTLSVGSCATSPRGHIRGDSCSPSTIVRRSPNCSPHVVSCPGRVSAGTASTGCPRPSRSPQTVGVSDSATSCGTRSGSMIARGGRAKDRASPCAGGAQAMSRRPLRSVRTPATLRTDAAGA